MKKLQKIKRKIKLFIEIKKVKSLLESRKTNSKICIHKKMHYYRDRTAMIKAKCLDIGRRFEETGLKDGTFCMRKNSKLNVKDKFTIYTGCSISVEENAELILGSGYISNNSSINCFKKITIGDNVIISKNVNIRDSDNHVIKYEGYEKEKEIIIGNNVWIGLNATILKGVTIGDNSIVAAGAIVTGDVPNNCIVAGVPAKIIKENICWEK